MRIKYRMRFQNNIYTTYKTAAFKPVTVKFHLTLPMRTTLSVILCFFFVIVTYGSESDTNNAQIMGDRDLRSTFLQLNCYGEALENVSFTGLNRTAAVGVRDAEFLDCLPSKIPYVKALRRINIYLPLLLRTLSLTFNLPPARTPLFDARHFENLTIFELQVHNSAESPWFREWSLDFLKPLQNLRILRFTNVDLPPLPDMMRLEEVSVNSGKSLGAWGGCAKIRELSFSRWNLEEISNMWLTNCSVLRTLELSAITKFTNKQMRSAVEGVRSLEKLSISGCGLDKLPTDLDSNVKAIYISFERFGQVPLGDIRMKSLTNLYIQHSSISELQGFPKLQGQFKLTLYQNRINSWRFESNDYELLQNRTFIVEGTNFVLDCDCQNGWLTRAIRDKRLTLLGSNNTCTDGTNLVQVSQSVTECDRFDCDVCTCRRQWSDNTTVARCAGAATRVPRVWGLRALHAAGNRVETVSADDLPDSLLHLDLSRNHITGVDVNTTREMFSIKNRRMRLAGNPFACTCGNKFLIETLQRNRKQVEDYNKIWCIDGELRLPIRDVVPSDLCAVEQQLQRDVHLSMSLGVFAVVLGFAAGAGVLCWRYRQHIKVYLYARGYCMWWLREEDVDSDRLYDAFVSFSHGDEQFVLEEIIPPLDKEYKLCLHYRDWVVGDFIPAQISRSVQLSRRTIIILSRNFVESVWGLLEFRTAHDNALREGRARIIVIILDDVVEDERLAPELRSYVRTNTYVRWGDRWFWDKMRYAMPHHRPLHSEPVTMQPTATNPSFILDPSS